MKKFFLVLFTFFALFAIGAGSAWLYLFSPVANASESVKFAVRKGDTLSSVAGRLEDEGFIRSKLSIRLLAKIEEKPMTLQPGLFAISSSMPPQTILDTLLTESTSVRVTIREGLRAEEIAEIFAQSLPESFDEEEFITLAKGKEGMLFPDTYDVAKESTAQTVLSLLTNTFDKRYKEALAGKTTDRLQDEVMTLASLIEREAKTPEGRRTVAGILLNRLELGMPLQVDATLQYAKGKNDAGEWWATPRGADKEVVSPYNTYKNPGLPPGPICNPGLDAIKAAINPEKSEYIYYISDTSGNMHYAVEYEKHLENIEKYLR